MTPLRSLALVALASCFSLTALAQNVSVSDAWARATVPGQKATGAFMKLTAKDNLKLVGVSSPAAGVSEIHEMKMDKDVMRMAAIPALDLPAGKAVELKPGSYHVMLMDLKAPLPKDGTVPLTLIFQDAKGQKSELALQVPVKAMMPAGQDGAMHQHKH
jgi:copper(I)-binding protein